MLGTADFTATTGTTIVLATGATSGDLIRVESFYVSSVLNAIQATAGAVNSTYITDSAVTTAKIADDAVTQAKIADGVAGTGPAFRAYLSTSQSITSGVATKVNIDTVSFDTNSWFDTTNKRYVPQIAGYYQIIGLVRCLGTSMTLQVARIYKNGSELVVGDLNRVATSSSIQVSVSDVVYLNGSTDYIELYGFITASSGTEFNYGASPSVTSYLSGYLVRAS